MPFTFFCFSLHLDVKDTLMDLRFLLCKRRMLFDDSRGVGEPLNETVCVGEKSCEGLTVR